MAEKGGGGGGGREMKAALKRAKEAIKSKDYQQALEHSKAALRLDPDHYHALVFVGKASTEVRRAGDAEEAYRRASVLEPSQLLAWQGLCDLYEKRDSPADREQLVGVYRHLLALLGDEAKERQVSENLANLYQKLGKPAEASHTLYAIIQSCGKDSANTERWTRIIRLLSPLQSLDKKSSSVLGEAFTTVLDAGVGEEEAQRQHHREYINFLMKGDSVDIDQIKAECSRMHQKFPTAAFPLKKLAEIVTIQTHGSTNSVDWSVYDELASLDCDSGLAMVGQAQVKLASEGAKAAKECLSICLKAKETQPTFPFSWLFLARCQLRLHDNDAVGISKREGMEALKTYKHPALQSTQQLKEEFLLLEASAWIDSGLVDRALRAIECLKKLSSEISDKNAVYKLLVHAYLVSGDLISAKQTFELIQANRGGSSDVTALEGWLLFHQGALEEAKDRLLAAISEASKADYHLWLGRVYWEMGGGFVTDREACFRALAQAAKLDPFNSVTFLYLGHYYMQISKDGNKAKGFYQKAFRLNPASDVVAMALGDTCDALDEKDEAIAVYTEVTNKAPAGGAKWAWLRLGLAQLRAGLANEAVESFQAVLRADPDDKHCQECLAEAYLSRGSYSAALKAFGRVIDMEPASTYPMFKIGSIKQTLGLYSEAISHYEAVLSQSPDYVPALSGQGETQLLMARAALHEFFDVRAVQYLQQAISVLTKAVLIRPDLCGIWKLLGDACTLPAPLHDSLVSITVDGTLVSKSEGTSEKIGKGELLALGGRCYTRAIRRRKDCASLWHDLAINYHRQHMWSDRRKMADKALQFIKKAITLDKANHFHWTALGVIAASEAIDDANLAQHAFIKSIQLEAKNVMAWTNLGTLYLIHGNLKLANEAYNASQALDPNYVQCWIGQAMIAETIGKEEAVELFRHTTEMTTHEEGGLGYADMVCHTLLDPNLSKESELYRYNITQMRAIPAAAAAVGKVADRVQISAEAHTLHGLLLERQGLHRAAEAAYKKAVHLLEDSGDEKFVNIALSNHARTLSASGCPEEARSQIQRIRPLINLCDILALGLALYRNKEWQEAYSVYEQALQLASTDSERSQILTAQAMVAYQSGDIGNTKTLLFKCSQLPVPCIQGLMALCALGLHAQDLVLINAALAELGKHPDRRDWSREVVVLATASLYIQGDKDGACTHLAKNLKDYPSDSSLWCLAAELALLFDSTKTELTTAYSLLAKQLDPTLKNIHLLDASAQLCAGNYGDPSSCHLSPALVAAQKAVHAMPGDINNWALLGASCSTQHTWQLAHQVKTELHVVSLKIAKFLLRMNTADSKLAAWVSLHTVLCLLQSQQWQEAAALSKQFLEWCDYGREANANLFLLCTLSDWMRAKKAAGLGAIRAVVTQSHSSLAWQTLGKIYADSRMLSAAVACYKQCLKISTGRRQMTLQHQLAYLAIMGLKAGADRGAWTDLGQQTLEELNRRTARQPIGHLLKGLLCHHLQKQERVKRRELEQGMKSIQKPGNGGYTESVLRVRLVETLVKKDKEAAQVLVDDAIQMRDPLSTRLKALITA